MKKFKVIVMSVFTLLLGSLLAACAPKKPEVNFTQTEVVVSVQNEIELDNYLTIKDAKKEDIDFRFSNSALFRVDGRKAVAINSGKSLVYATYKGNSLASMQIVVRKKFASPTSMTMDKTGLVTWNAVSSFYENEENPTVAESYKLVGTFTSASGETSSVDETVSTNKFQLTDAGTYTLKVKALTKGYFDESEYSSEQTFYLGFMDEVSEMTFSNGILSWNEIANAKYKVKVGDAILDNFQMTTTKDLNTYFETAEAGEYEISVIVYDVDNVKIAKESSPITVTKLSKPNASYDFSTAEGGRISITTEINAEFYNLEIKNLKTNEISNIRLENDASTVYSDLQGLDFGLYELKISAYSDNNLFYESAENLFGKVYKLPTVTISGKDINSENGASFNLNASILENLVKTSVGFFGDFDSDLSFEIDELSKDFTLTKNEAGVFSLKTKLKPFERENSVQGENVFVLNSDESETVNLTKLDQVAQLKHVYENEKSVLQFSTVENANSYTLFLFDGENYVEVPEAKYDYQAGKFVFIDKLEKLFAAANGEYKFKLVAKTNSDEFAINSSVEKTIVVLNAPTTANSGNSTDKTYTWTAAENANAYDLEIYTIDKTKYDAFLTNSEIDISQLSPTKVQVDTNEYAFENVGYYYVKIFAVSNNEDLFISSKEFLGEVFYIAEKLSLGTVDFGYLETYKDQTGMTNASGYFLKIQNAENVDSFRITVGVKTVVQDVEGVENSYTIYRLEETFEADEVSISVVGLANDETLYNQSDAKTIAVQRLKSVNYTDSNLKFNDDTTELTLDPVDGVTKIRIWDENKPLNQTIAEGKQAKFDISSYSSVFLRFDLFGTSITEDGIFNASNGKVYLDSSSSVLHFERLPQPTNFEYYGGNLKFEQENTTNVNHYMLELVCQTANGEEKKLSVKFSSLNTSVIIDGDSKKIGSAEEFRSINGNVVTLFLSNVLDKIKEDENLASFLNQALKIEFQVYSYQKKTADDNSKCDIASLRATLKSDVSSIVLVVEKMKETDLSLDLTAADLENTYTFSWAPVATNDSVNSQTKYKLYLEEQPEFSKEILSTTTFALAKTEIGAKASTYYTFYIKATNPYYLDSNNSNFVKIYQLKNLAQVSLTDDGYLSFPVETSENDFVDYVKVTYNGTSTENRDAKVLLGENFGNYTLQLIGKVIDNTIETNTKTYYLNSQAQDWNVENMSALAPADQTVTYAGGLLSWNAFAQNAGLSTLSYLVTFKDANNKTATFETDQTSINLLTNTELYNTVSALAAGDITVEVAAHIGAYKVASGQTVYYSPSQQLLTGNSNFNYYIYTSSITIKKLTIPNVSTVEFLDTDINIVYPDFAENSALNAQDLHNPNMSISFVGNYGDKISVSVFLNDSDISVFTGDIQKANEKYTFVLNKAEYENGFVNGVMTIKIRVNDETSLPSSYGNVEINRAPDLKSVEFKNNAESFEQKLVVTFDETNLDCLTGGLVFKINYLKNGTSEIKTLFSKVDIINIDEANPVLEFDLTETFKTILSEGGQISVFAFINNFDNQAPYYLASENEIQTSAQTNILKAVKSKNISTKAGGFVIENINNNTTTYVVKYGGNTFEVKYENSEFYFEFPNDWTNGEYKLKIFAKENNYINSVETEITFNLNRISAVSRATLLRDETNLTEISLSWDAVENAGGYLLKVFKTEEETPLFSKTLTADKTSYKINELFGENYEELGLNNVEFENDLTCVFKLITVGSVSGGAVVANNSSAYDFNVTIKGNMLLEGNLEAKIKMDEFGRIVFDTTENSTYFYKFLSSTEMQDYRTVTANSNLTILDTKDFAKLLPSATTFDVEIKVQGDVSAFELDSYTASTSGRNPTFVFVDPLISVGFEANLVSSFAIEAITDGFEKIFVGTSENAIDSGDVVEIGPTLTEIPAQVNTNSIYSYSFAELVDKFNEKGIDFTQNSKTTLYFWVFKTNDSRNNVLSKPYEFSFDYFEQTSFEGIQKLGKIETNENYDEDYLNTFAVFANNDGEADGKILLTLGIYVKITDISSSKKTVKFVTNAQLQNPIFGQGKFVINLTEIFEQDDLKDLTGKFSLEFAILQVETNAAASNTNTFKLSSWLKEKDGKTFDFTRVEQVNALNLKNGNLTWKANANNGLQDGETVKYYVFFIQDLDVETGKLGEKYNYFSTEDLQFNVSNFVGTNAKYYIAVQCVSESPYVLASIKTFITSENIPVEIYKNQINSPLKLKDGKLYIDWTENSEIYKILQLDNYTEMAEQILDESNPFLNPFTFTLKDLMSDNVKIRIRFTPNTGVEGKSKSFDVNAKLLLSSLVTFFEEKNTGKNVESILHDLYTNESDSTRRGLLLDFKTYVTTGSYGIANHATIFDDIFEALQTGNYKMDYCLLGNDKTLTSFWYSFENNQRQNTVFVNSEPIVKAIKETDSREKSINSYKILIKKSKITDFDSTTSQYIEKYAENYVLKLKQSSSEYFIFEISKGITNYSLKMLDSKITSSVSVFETNELGQEQSGSDYLMFYVNHNNGNSLLGVYGDLLGKLTYEMQIYAVGNNYSMSSKSEFFSFTLLGFGSDFTINEGVFTWGAQQGRSTAVILKKKTSSLEEEVDVTTDSQQVFARFSLENYGDGLYDYLKFVMFGEISGNHIFIDSEVYQLNNVYKLSAPTLSSVFGYINIDDSANDAKLANCYSDSNLYNYRLYNDTKAYKETDSSTYIYLTKATAADTLLYEPGTTGLEAGSDEFTYKQTEEKAKEFYASSLGTSSSFIYETDATENEEHYKPNYYLKSVYCKDNENLKVDKYVAVRSSFSSLKSQMMSETQNLSISDGVLHWDDVTNSADFSVEEANGQEVVYKISVVQYRLSSTSSKEENVQTNIDKEYVYYTAKNEFDFTYIEEDLNLENLTGDSYLKATVQALALNVSSNLPGQKHVNLIEGGYAYGSVTYKEDNTVSVLIGNGEQLDGIVRLNRVDELRVSQGKLVWNFTAPDKTTTEENFTQKYSFEVRAVDASGKESVVNGQFQVSLLSGTTFKITFIEDKGQMPAGVLKLKVYTTPAQGQAPTEKYIKSFARETTAEITKLETISSEDFVIQSDINFETLDLSKYFEDLNDNIVTVKVSLNGEEPFAPVAFSRQSNKYKMLILKSEADKPNVLPEGYVSQYLIVSEDQVATLTFDVTNTTQNILYSDTSEAFLLQRSSWGENKISWDEKAQTFNWDYGYSSIQRNILADKMKKINVITQSVTLYQDQELTTESGTIETGTEITILEKTESYIKISYNEEELFIANANVEELLKTEESGVTLHAGDVFKIIEIKNDLTIIEYDDGKLYQVASSEIIAPVYMIEVTYFGETPEDDIVRVYTSSNNTFTPTIVGKVSIKVRIKLSSANIQSQELEYINAAGENFEILNLFEAGEGTPNSPYIIQTKEQFKNINYRKTKDQSMTSYSHTVENNLIEVTEAQNFYFSIISDLYLSDKTDSNTFVDGVLFAGEFSGNLNGNNHTISYVGTLTNSGTRGNLSSGITVAVGNIKGPTADDTTSTTYYNGISLFETFGTTANVQNIKLDVSYSNTDLSAHTLVAGLVISNGGNIQNIDLVNFQNGGVSDDGFEFGLTATDAEKIMVVYSGIASINLGNTNTTISKCNISTNMRVYDNNRSQVIFLSGIVYTNYGKIENCKTMAGKEIKISCTVDRNLIQISGIAITNSSGTLKSNTNNMKINVSCNIAAEKNLTVVYIAGISALQAGTAQDNVNSVGQDGLTTSNINNVARPSDAEGCFAA